MTVEADAAPPLSDPPLCVDLDGTLVKSDTFQDALCNLLRHNPMALLRAPFWLRGGRAGVKHQVAQRAPLEPAHLPYNNELIRFLQAEHRRGRSLYLATGADGELAQRVAAHLGLFQGVLASNGETNLTRERKLHRLREQFGSFDYVGNSRADLILLAHARQAMVANPTLGLRLALRKRNVAVQRVFLDLQPVFGSLLSVLHIRRWSINLLLFLPLLLAHRITRPAVAAAFTAFLCFSFLASAGWLVDGLLHMESDRRNPARRMGPFAAGNLTVTAGVALAAALVLGSVALLPRLPSAFAFYLGLYFLAGPLYVLFLRRVPILGALLLAGLCMVRLLAGGAATATPLPHDLAAVAALLFFVAALAARVVSGRFIS
ncbi:MAG TPA: prenyltransferase [Terracidiphilus sp.]|nr:prenyltransferase [Terracidiphilus sp.]